MGLTNKEFMNKTKVQKVNDSIKMIKEAVKQENYLIYVCYGTDKNKAKPKGVKSYSTIHGFKLFEVKNLFVNWINGLFNNVKTWEKTD